MKHQLIFIRTALILISFLGIGAYSTYAQSAGADLFDEYCADCHSIGEGDMKGPDLMGVEYRYSNKWLLKFIKSSQTVIKAGDPAAVKIWTKFEKNKMPNTKLSDDEIQVIIAYIKSLNTSKPKPVVVQTKKGLKKGNANKGASASNQKIDELSSKVDAFGGKINNLEKKINQLIEIQKKALQLKPTSKDIAKGKELFLGRKNFNSKGASCVSCHNIYKIDSLNWNPSAVDLANTYTQTNYYMKDLLLKPQSDKMKAVFKEHELTDNEAFYVASYINSLEKTELIELPKSHKNLYLFIFIALIMTLAVSDLLFTHKIKPRWINVVLFLLSFAYVANATVNSATEIDLSEGYTPLQPIKFSHKVHVKQNDIKCIFCHNSPEFSKVSGIPSLNACMICHKKVNSGTNSGKFEINKLKKAYKEKTPIKWVRVHSLPDHVFFSHAQHVTIAKQDCKTCHGDVKEMDLVTQVSPLSMGWCINCHKNTEVNFKKNKFYRNFTELHDALKSGKIKKVTADQIGANDCQKCHY